MYKLLLGAGFVLMLGAVACTAAQPAQPSGADDKPRYGGTINSTVTDDPWDFDMTLQGSSNTNGTMLRMGYSSLMRQKTGADMGYYGPTTPEPLLADRWEVSPDAANHEGGQALASGH